MSHPSSASTGFRPDIEGLRAIAVLLVVAYHAGVPGISGGFIGVDVFFALSGYLITGLLIREWEATGRISLPAFYARRVRRLLPAAAVVLLATMGLATFVGGPMGLADVAPTALATSLYAANVYFVHGAKDYFAPDAETNPLLHTWSLSVEEQFYVVWPALILAVLWAGRTRQRLRWILIGLSLGSFAVAWWYSIVQQPVAFYHMPHRAWEFAIGGVAALAPALPSRWRGVALWGGLAMIGGAAVTYTRHTLFPGTAALAPVIGTVLVLAAHVPAGAATDGWGLRRAGAALLRIPMLQGLGRLSYSWYLWHWPLLVLGTSFWPGLSLVGRFGIATAALAIAWLSYRVVEQPLRHHARLGASVRAALGLGAVTTALLAVVAWGALHGAETWAKTPAMRAFHAAASDQPVYYARGCGVDYTDTTLKVCAFGDTTSATTIVLFGDSHAIHWLPALEPLAHARGWRLIAFGKGACPSADVAHVEERLGRRYVECEVWREKVMRRVAALRPAAVITSNTWRYVRGERPAVSLPDWKRGLARTLARLDSVAAVVVLVTDVPRHAREVPRCLARVAWYAPDAMACATPRHEALNVALQAVERQIVADIPGTHLLDLTPILCDGTRCPAIVNDTVRYMDDNHLAATFAATQMPAFAVLLDSLLVRP